VIPFFKSVFVPVSRCSTGRAGTAGEELDAELPGSPPCMEDSPGAFPDSINWSSVPKYLLHSSFHKLAMACSGPKTAYMHSMTWMLDVKDAAPIHSSRFMNPNALTSTWQTNTRLN
jgi:hypothetical protein